MYDPRSKGAESYIKLAKEILENERSGATSNAKRWVKDSRRYSQGRHSVRSLGTAVANGGDFRTGTDSTSGRRYSSESHAATRSIPA